MPHPLPVTLACGLYESTRPLLSGQVVPEGIELRVITPGTAGEIFWRMIRYQEYDASELSMAALLVVRELGHPKLVAIPVFPSRTFRHRSLLVRPEAGIHRPADLAGKRLGVPEYHMTAALWVRGILQDEYGVRPESIRWVVGGLERPDREERVALSLPPSIQIERLGPGQTLLRLLEQNDLDAVIVPGTLKQTKVALRPLFPNYKEEEAAYFRRTGLFPIMHTVVIRQDVYERSPWVAQSLYQAFKIAKALWYHSLDEPGGHLYGLPWFDEAVAETRTLMGTDFWPYGVEANRKVLETMARYSFEQGLTHRKAEVNELFAPSTRVEHGS